MSSHQAPEQCSAKAAADAPPRHLPSEHATAEPDSETAVRYN